MIHLSLHSISKHFGRRKILQEVTHLFEGGAATAIVGPNGSGKSTLARICAGVLRADSGRVELSVNRQVIERGEIPHTCGYVAPYLSIYDEFTPRELIAMHAALHGKTVSDDICLATLTRVGLQESLSIPVRSFSSGMRQRMIIALAVVLDPALLILDEPSTTLDERGRSILAHEIDAAKHRGAVVIIATNDKRERELCSDIVVVG